MLAATALRMTTGLCGAGRSKTRGKASGLACKRRRRDLSYKMTASDWNAGPPGVSGIPRADFSMARMLAPERRVGHPQFNGNGKSGFPGRLGVALGMTTVCVARRRAVGGGKTRRRNPRAPQTAAGALGYKRRTRPSRGREGRGTRKTRGKGLRSRLQKALARPGLQELGKPVQGKSLAPDSRSR